MSAALLLALVAAGELRLVRHEPEPAQLAAWSALSETREQLRGFRAPILGNSGAQMRLTLPDPNADPSGARAARVVATRLAREGLRATLVAALVELGPKRVLASEDAHAVEEIGLPLDLLGCYGEDGAALAVRAARALAAGRTPAEALAEIASRPFEFRPALKGWRVMLDTGEEAPGLVRVQVSSASDYAAAGEGGALDVLRGLATGLGDVPLVASVSKEHADALDATVRKLATERSAPITIVVEPLEVSQWAQDAARAGTTRTRTAAWLAPRYASRGEGAPEFVPGESLIAEGLAAAGLDVAQSSLLFQGGNLLAARDPKDGTRWLVLGEAEVARNRALGLSQEEVLAAFRAEFGVDRCLVLPAVSFHVDLELTLRAAGGQLVACVLDTSRASRIVIEAGIGALLRGGEIPAATADAARAALAANARGELLDLVARALEPHAHGRSGYSTQLAERFSAGATDSGPANLQRFLLALDVFAAEGLGTSIEADSDTRAYLESLRRREQDRIRVAQALEERGWRVVAVPGFSDQARSMNPLNGLHLPGAYLQPAVGGLYEPLDVAASEAFAAAWGADVEIRRVPTYETQRRSGGLHCAVALGPR